MSTSNVLGKGRTALVTGASRGIGPLIAGQIASYGGHVVLSGRSAADLKAVTSDLAAGGADVSFIPCDLTAPGAAEAADHLAVAAADFWVQDDPDGAPGPADAGAPVRMILTVSDPDATWAEAVAAGATPVYPVTDGHGWHIGRIADPAGHHWEIGRPLDM